MPKGYWIARLDVTDPEAYKAYVEANAEAFAKYEGKFLTRGGSFTPLEGLNRSRNCIVEFKDRATALACYWSPEYQRALQLRKYAAVADIIIMDGYDGPQPPEKPGDAANVRGTDPDFPEIAAQLRNTNRARALLGLSEYDFDVLTAACQS